MQRSIKEHTEGVSFVDCVEKREATNLPTGTSCITTTGVPVVTAATTVGRGVDRIEATIVGTSSTVLINMRLGAADLGVAVLLAVLALDPRIWSNVSM